MEPGDSFRAPFPDRKVPLHHPAPGLRVPPGLGESMHKGNSPKRTAAGVGASAEEGICEKHAGHGQGSWELVGVCEEEGVLTGSPEMMVCSGCSSWTPLGRTGSS